MLSMLKDLSSVVDDRYQRYELKSKMKPTLSRNHFARCFSNRLQPT
jgi:hypothetical protein